MLVYVVRHGESETNLAKRWTGWLDVALTEKGKKDAEIAREFLSGISFDKVYSSDLCRAEDTAKIALPGCSYEKSSLLREICLGSLEGKPISSDLIKVGDGAAKNGYASFGGESREDLQKRVTSFMEILEGLECDTVAVFSHAGWLRTMLDETVGMTLPRKTIRCTNCAVGIFEYDGGVWQLHSWINLT